MYYAVSVTLFQGSTCWYKRRLSARIVEVGLKMSLVVSEPGSFQHILRYVSRGISIRVECCNGLLHKLGV